MNKKFAIIHEEIHPLLEKIKERMESLKVEVELVHWSKISYTTGNNLENYLSKFDVIYLDRMGEHFSSYYTQLHLLEEFNRRNKDINIINSPEAYAVARNKALMALKLEEADLPIPKTKVVFNIEQVVEFCESYDNNHFIAKSYLGACAEDIYTFQNSEIPIEVNNLLKRDGVAIVQEFVLNPEKYIWRIDVVNSEIIQCNQRFSYNDDSETPICNGTMGGDIIIWDPQETPENVKQLAIKAVENLDLCIAGVDILVSADQNLYVAEVNPEPDITLGALGFPNKIADFLIFTTSKNNQK
ncbi:ATP-grasp domain-containing protein [Priestia flexa]|uniref:ATP-grasp domain-containing protein n=1 Tax=Priestia flexa TaxID=86664 RepID=UPI00077C3D12|nr:ATP-grasp domain-containing protein [Priestia flexa]MED4589892.1 ATP-grasp domain-containing protein [Priestia flexa]